MNYSKANRLLFLSTGFMLVLIILLLVKPSVSLYKACDRLTNKLQVAIQASRSCEELNDKIAMTDRLLLTEKENDIDRGVLEAISEYCEVDKGLTLKAFPKTTVTKSGDYLLETHVFTMEGPYSNLIEMLYDMEQRSVLGKVASVKFSTEIDYRLKKKYLLATIYLQTIKKAA